jgi:hypothetical protein
MERLSKWAEDLWTWDDWRYQNRSCIRGYKLREMVKESARQLPLTFVLHWGNGRIVEEATYAGQHHQPSLQLLEFEDGPAAVRFCYYDHAGSASADSPFIVSNDEIAGLKDALAAAPRLRSLLRELVS